MSIELDLLNAVTNEIKQLIGDRGDVQTRLMPLLERREFGDEELKVTVYWDGGETEIRNRRVDGESYAVGIALQKPVPHATTSERGNTTFSGVDNIPFANEMLDLAREVTQLWTADAGDLRDVLMADCLLTEIDRGNLFEYAHLMTKGIFSVVIIVHFGRTIDEDD